MKVYIDKCEMDIYVVSKRKSEAFPDAKWTDLNSMLLKLFNDMQNAYEALQNYLGDVYAGGKK